MPKHSQQEVLGCTVNYYCLYPPCCDIHKQKNDGHVTVAEELCHCYNLGGTSGGGGGQGGAMGEDG